MKPMKKEIRCASRAEAFATVGAYKREGWRERMRDESEYYVTVQLVKGGDSILVMWKR